MADNIEFDISEVRELAAKLGTHSQETTIELRKALNASIGRVFQAAKSSAPVDTGELRASIRRTSGNRGDLYRRVWSATRQGFFQEYGTSRHPPRPWITPALQAEETTFINEVNKIVGRGL